MEGVVEGSGEDGGGGEQQTVRVQGMRARGWKGKHPVGCACAVKKKNKGRTNGEGGVLRLSLVLFLKRSREVERLREGRRRSACGARVRECVSGREKAVWVRVGLCGIGIVAKE